MAVAACLTGFCLNGVDYGGSFDFTLSFPQLMMILTVVCVMVMPCTWYFIKEEKHPGVNVRDYMAEFWDLMQSCAMYQVIAYKFFSGILEKQSTIARSPMESFWAKAQPLNDTIAGVLGNVIFSLVLYFTMKKGLN